MELRLIPWFGQTIGSAVEGVSWSVAFLILSLVYFYSHYFFASNTAHVSSMYGAFLAVAIAVGTPPMLAALVLGFFSNLFSSMTHYGTGPAPGVVRVWLRGNGDVVEAGSLGECCQYCDLVGSWRSVVEGDRGVVTAGRPAEIQNPKTPNPKTNSRFQISNLEPGTWNGRGARSADVRGRRQYGLGIVSYEIQQKIGDR